MIHAELALVTGASSGLGRALCIALAKRQIPLILVARDKKKLEELAKTLSVPCHVHAADLSTPEARKALIHLIQEKQPDLVINNAGFGTYGPLLSHPLSEMEQMLEVNAQAVMELSIETARTLIQAKKKGTIVNISSAAAFFSYPSFCVYAASKAFVNRFSEAFDEEVKSQGVRVITVCPGQIDTSFRARASGGYPQEKDRITMSSQKAAELIIKQIKKGKALSIIDWRYRYLIAFTRLLPKRLLQAFLKRSLTKRHNFSD